MRFENKAVVIQQSKTVCMFFQLAFRPHGIICFPHKSRIFYILVCLSISEIMQSKFLNKPILSCQNACLQFVPYIVAFI